MAHTISFEENISRTGKSALRTWRLSTEVIDLAPCQAVLADAAVS